MSRPKRTAVVVGGASGIGRASAKLLAQQGWAVAIADAQPTDEVVAELSAHGTVEGRTMDLAAIPPDEDTLRAVGDAPLGAVIITAALMGRLIPVRDYPFDDFRRIVDVNLVGTFFFARAAAEALARNGGGRLILFMSGAGRSPGKVTIAPYILTKGAVPLMVDILSKAYGPFGVLVAAVDPGRTATPMIMGPVYDSMEKAAAADELPAGRVLDPSEVAEVVAFLCSDRASGVTNAVWGVSTRA